MRVIAGTARSVPLKAPRGDETRPTADKIKETLFNILQADVPDCVFVDLFSGSGGVGIEALSRGAHKALFCDRSKEAVDCINANLEKCRLADKAVVYRTEAEAALARVRSFIEDDRDTIFFLDPPYDRGLEYPVIERLVSEGLLRGCDILVAEKSNDRDTMEEFTQLCERLSLDIYKVKTYKNQQHVFIRKA